MPRSAPLFCGVVRCNPESTLCLCGSRLCGAALHAAPRPGHGTRT